MLQINLINFHSNSICLMIIIYCLHEFLNVFELCICFTLYTHKYHKPMLTLDSIARNLEALSRNLALIICLMHFKPSEALVAVIICQTHNSHSSKTMKSTISSRICSTTKHICVCVFVYFFVCVSVSIWECLSLDVGKRHSWNNAYRLPLCK